MEPITEITFTLNLKPTSSIPQAILGNNSTSSYTFSDCIINGKEVKCTTNENDNQINAGNYILKEVKGGDKYNVDQIKDMVIKYEINPLAETQSETEPILNLIHTSFTIDLADASVSTVNI